MADLKISQLTGATTPLAGTELVPVVQSGTTKKVSVANLTTFTPSFSVYFNGLKSITPNTFTKIELNTEEWDTNNFFDNATNYRFLPTIAGYYQISAGVTFTNSTAPTRGLLSVFKNGSEYKRLDDNNVSGYMVGGACMVYLNGSTDYVELYTYISAATAVYGDSNSVSTYMCGVLAHV